MASKIAKKTRGGPSRRDASGKSFPPDGVGMREILAIFIGGSALTLFLALVSYAPEDLPAWVPFSTAAETTGATFTRNYIGPLGAIVAGYCYFFFGAASYLMPAVLLWWAVQVMTSGSVVRARNLIALTVFVIAGACLIEYQELLFQEWVSLYNLPRSPGGLIGHALGDRFAVGLLGSTGSFIAMTLLYVIALIVITGIHPFRLALLARDRSDYYWRKYSWEQKRSSQIRRDMRRQTNRPRPDASRLDRFFSPSPAERPGETADHRAASFTSRAVPQRRIVDASQATDPIPAPAVPIGQPTGANRRNPDQSTISTVSNFENYRLPSFELLSYGNPAKNNNATDERILIEIQNIIVDTLNSFNVPVLPGDITKGPAITRYEIYPSPGLRINKITALQADLARATRAERINILAPIPGKDTVGIEIANRRKVAVPLRELFDDPVFRKSKAKLPLALGKDVYGATVVGDLTKMPHLLVAGATGSGKSVCINTIIASLLFRFTPDELRFIMIDPKVVEMQLYNDLPHMVVPVVTEPKKVLLALRWVINEMERRYTLFAESGSRNFEGYRARRNETGAGSAGALENLPYIVVIIDELADLMQTAPADVETGIARIAQKARAAGIHLIVATQTPRADVVTGLIKANIPSRIAFQVSSKSDSRIILDENGAENLVGKGDMLYLPPGSAQMIRAQGALITDEETQALVDACSAQGKPDFGGASPSESIFDEMMNQTNGGEAEVSDADEELVARCMEVIFAEKRASTSLLQRRLRLGYTRAARMIDLLEDRGIIGPGDGAKPREILVDLSQESC